MRLRDYHKVQIVGTSKGKKPGCLEFDIPIKYALDINDPIRVLAKPKQNTSVPSFTYATSEIVDINGKTAYIHIPQIANDPTFDFSVELPPNKKKKTRIMKTIEKFTVR